MFLQIYFEIYRCCLCGNRFCIYYRFLLIRNLWLWGNRLIYSPGCLLRSAICLIHSKSIHCISQQFLSTTRPRETLLVIASLWYNRLQVSLNLLRRCDLFLDWCLFTKNLLFLGWLWILLLLLRVVERIYRLRWRCSCNERICVTLSFFFGILVLVA